jgi:hypothetical protein
MVCARASPMPTIFPSGPVAVVPETVIMFPIFTAREYPTMGSHGAPLEIFSRAISFLLGLAKSIIHSRLFQHWHQQVSGDFALMLN